MRGAQFLRLRTRYSTFGVPIKTSYIRREVNIFALGICSESIIQHMVFLCLVLVTHKQKTPNFD